MYEHILAPIDGSELSAHACNQAVQLASILGSHITFLHVQPDYPRPIVGEGALIAPENRDDFFRNTASVAKEILDKAAGVAAAAGVPAVTRTEVSDVPWGVITRIAEAEKCDLIFMASHGRRGLANLLLGSETHKVQTHTTIPVLVYREK